MRGHEKGVVIRQFLHLLCRNFGKAVVAVADVHTPQTRHRVEDTVVFAVGQPHAFGAGDNAGAALCQNITVGKRVHVVSGIERLKLCCGGLGADHIHEGAPFGAKRARG